MGGGAAGFCAGDAGARVRAGVDAHRPRLRPAAGRPRWTSDWRLAMTQKVRCGLAEGLRQYLNRHRCGLSCFAAQVSDAT